ncbi:MAG: hypothetical protein ACE5GX_11570 [Thermoanaerobaculia bacterium]
MRGFLARRKASKPNVDYGLNLAGWRNSSGKGYGHMTFQRRFPEGREGPWEDFRQALEENRGAGKFGSVDLEDPAPLVGVQDNQEAEATSTSEPAPPRAFNKLAHGEHPDDRSLVERFLTRPYNTSDAYQHNTIDAQVVALSMKERIKLAGQLHARRQRGAYHLFEEALQTEPDVATRCLSPLDLVDRMRRGVGAGAPEPLHDEPKNVAQVMDNFHHRYPRTASSRLEAWTGKIPRTEGPVHPYWQAHRRGEHDVPNTGSRSFPIGSREDALAALDELERDKEHRRGTGSSGGSSSTGF